MELVLCFVIITISGVIRESSALLLRSPTSNDVFGELVASAERAQPLATRLTKRISRLNFNDREDDFWEDHGDASWNNSYTLVNGRTTLGSENRRRPASDSLIERPYYRDGRLSPVLGVQERRGRSVHSYHEEPVSFFDQRAFDEYTFRRRSQLHRQRARAGLRSRIKQNVRRLWTSARGAVRGWGRRVRRKIGDLFVGHLMPQLRRLRFWDQGLPPVVPPLIGNEPGQASVALVAERMEARLREKTLTEKNPTEAQQAVGTYLINSAENTWFISIPGGRYILLKKRGFLGGGGFGLVYHVEHPTTGQPFALKIFVQRVLSNKEGDRVSDLIEDEFGVMKYFPPEWTPARMYSELRFMVPLLKLRVLGKPEFQDARNHLRIFSVCALFPKAQGDLEEAAALLADMDRTNAYNMRMSSTIQMVKLLARFHAFGLVHGDVKLQNFLVDKSGLLLLSDFTQILRTNERRYPPVVTVLYMSPEIATCLITRLRNAIPYTAEIDSWMLGISLYRLWCGDFPFGITLDATALQVAGIVIRSSASSLDFASCHDIPEQFREMIVGFLRKTPGVRLSPQQALEQFSLLNWKGPSPASDTASESEPVSTEEAALLQKE
ncbi:rhoptry protein ROP17 [Toxoplasma gondii GAB2-2007-GAL-DOM2]|uniref:Rhoptry protein ROP17 n=4 Tax=Toxoplasma gondii TaxID=5811 RepID=A0A086K0T1_TOXGO|nr:rhoptry protein ROP17 [Toxoplasma gondii GAB2-2007-GAL-DOM2]KFG37999.1 rhoptry protein ROP17 [Toxoplasma gondii FOU]PUA84214.1 rhoptry protein ROP17 [Toxoplasma gondii TgCATBr9]RQX71143.1 rhoptry protein ROP17 [Toxoplasma gondii CAST]